ncbi:MAG: Clp protease ClpP [Clostridiales bacterium]|nr:Clp protease ClpP [Eubacterium sp.]MDD7349739.1 Clp protease ClpP [Clostridiales bacterium]
MNKFWKFQNSKYSDNEAELYLYGEICSEEPWWDEDYVAYRQFIQELNECEADTIHVRVNSPGGDVMSAFAIFSQLKDSNKHIIAHIDGMCASAATIIIMAADEIIASCNAMVLIHDPLVGLSGYYNESDLKKMLEDMSAVKESIIASYRSRISDISEEEFSTLMSEEKWLTAQEAVDLGLVDEIAYSNISDIRDCGKYIMVNSVRVDKTHLSKEPDHRFVKNVNLNTSKKPIDKKTDKGGNTDMGDKNEKLTTVADLQAAYPELCTSMVQDAVNQERKRMKALDDIANAVPQEMLEKAKYEEPKDAKEVAYEAILKEKKVGANFMEDLRNDAEKSGAKNITPAPKDVQDDDVAEGSNEKNHEKRVSRLSNAFKNVQQKGGK